MPIICCHEICKQSRSWICQTANHTHTVPSYGVGCLFFVQLPLFSAAFKQGFYKGDMSCLSSIFLPLGPPPYPPSAYQRLSATIWAFFFLFLPSLSTQSDFSCVESNIFFLSQHHLFLFPSTLPTPGFFFCSVH